MKKIWITIGIIMLVLALALLVLVIVGGNEKVQGSSESLYKYYYQRSNSGYKVVVSGDFPVGSSWSTFVEGENVSCTVKRQNNKKAVFVVETVKLGFGTVYFSLENNSSSIPDRQYEIVIDTTVDANNVLTFNSFSHVVTTPLRNGSAADLSYEAGELVDGSLKAIIYSKNPEKWNIVKDQIADYSVEKTVTENSVCFSIKRLEGFNGDIYVCSDDFETALKLEVYTDDVGHLRINHCSVANYINDTYSKLEDDYFLLVGETSLPSGATIKSKKTTYWISKEDGVTGNYVGVLEFSFKDADWILYTSDVASINDLSADLISEYPKAATKKSGKINVKLYTDNAPLSATWESKGGYRYLLVGGNLEIFNDAVLEIAASVK